MDRISNLPSEILCHILSFLPTKHAVATSILSSRWVNLWVSLHVIDLDDSLYLQPARNRNALSFFIFVERVLSLNRSPTLVKFRLHVHDCSGEDLSRINGIIRNVKLRNVVEVDFGIFCGYPVHDECLKIPPCQFLEMLRIKSDYGFQMPAIGVLFPNLRTFDVKIPILEASGELTTELFPSLPVLENLSFQGDLADCNGEAYVNIGGAALKSLEVELVENFEFYDAMVVIDSPNLEYLHIKDRFLASYSVKNRPSLREVKLDVGDYYEAYVEYMEEMDISRCDPLRELLQCLTNTKFLSVSAISTLVIFARRWDPPILQSLIKLELNVYICNSILVLYWLGTCPNLKFLSLTIEDQPLEDYEHVLDDLQFAKPDYVPSCLSLNLTDTSVLPVHARVS